MHTIMTFRPAGRLKRPCNPMVNVRCGSSLKDVLGLTKLTGKLCDRRKYLPS